MQFRRRTLRPQRQTHRRRGDAAPGANKWPNPRFQPESHTGRRGLAPGRGPKLPNEYQNQINHRHAPANGFAPLPDDRKIILPLARRIKGKKICVRRAAPKEQDTESFIKVKDVTRSSTKLLRRFSSGRMARKSSRPTHLIN